MTVAGGEEGGELLHLVCKGQGYCETSFNAQDNLSQQRITAQMSIALELRNPGINEKTLLDSQLYNLLAK